MLHFGFVFYWYEVIAIKIGFDPNTADICDYSVQHPDEFKSPLEIARVTFMANVGSSRTPVVNNILVQSAHTSAIFRMAYVSPRSLAPQMQAESAAAT